MLRHRRKGKPSARRGRKATGLSESAGLPNRLPREPALTRGATWLLPGSRQGRAQDENGESASCAWTSEYGASHDGIAVRRHRLRVRHETENRPPVEHVEGFGGGPLDDHDDAAGNHHNHRPGVAISDDDDYRSRPGCGTTAAGGRSRGQSEFSSRTLGLWLCRGARLFGGEREPEFTFQCPGYADGYEAMTCVNIAGLCSDEHLIAINDPCQAAYMNEAYNSNSWSDSLAEFTRPIDPYGAC